MLYFFNFNSSINLVVPVPVLHVAHVPVLALLVLLLVLLVQLNCRLQLNQNPPCILFTPAHTCTTGNAKHR